MTVLAPAIRNQQEDGTVSALTDGGTGVQAAAHAVHTPGIAVDNQLDKVVVGVAAFLLECDRVPDAFLFHQGFQLGRGHAVYIDDL